jgi:hypothetical protein
MRRDFVGGVKENSSKKFIRKNSDLDQQKIRMPENWCKSSHFQSTIFEHQAENQEGRNRDRREKDGEEKHGTQMNEYGRKKG